MPKSTPRKAPATKSHPERSRRAAAVYPTVDDSNDVIPETTKDQAAIQQLITRNLANPKLLGNDLQFTRKQPGQ